jgi:pimeloyl-ACP methyl ester carboxylesterase
LDTLLAALGVKKTAVAVAGAFGAMISLKFCSGLPPLERAFTFLSGLPLAWYCGPWLAEQLSASSPQSELGVVCITGAVGVAVLSRVVEALPELVIIAKDFLRKKAT